MARLVNNKEIRRYRLTIFLRDFRECQAFAEFILKKRLHQKKTDQSQLVRLAFETSFVISYARPFGPNKERPGEGRSSLEAAVSDVLLDDQEQRLHALIIDRRDRAYAHSDASAHLIPGFNYDRNSVQLMASFQLLTELQVRMLNAIIKKWIAYVTKERSYIAAVV